MTRQLHELPTFCDLTGVGLISQIITIDNHRVLFSHNFITAGRIYSVLHIPTYTWLFLPKFPTGQNHFGRRTPKVLIHREHIYVFIGHEWKSTLWRTKLNEYDFNDVHNTETFMKSIGPMVVVPTLCTWEEIPPNYFAPPLLGFSTTSDDVNDSIYICGGYKYTEHYEQRITVSSLQCFHPSNSIIDNIVGPKELRDDHSWRWENLPDIPMKRRDHIGIRVKNKIYLFGGYGYNDEDHCLGQLSCVHVFCISSKTWGITAPVPKRNIGTELSAIVMQNRWILLFCRKGDDPCFILDTKCNIWLTSGGDKEVGIMPEYDHVKAVNLDDTLLLVGRDKKQHLYRIHSIPFQHLHPWFAVGHVILLQKLFHDKRASPVPLENFSVDDCKFVGSVQSMIVDINDDLFRSILLFLINHPVSRNSGLLLP